MEASPTLCRLSVVCQLLQGNLKEKVITYSPKLTSITLSPVGQDMSIISLICALMVVLCDTVTIIHSK